MKQKLRTDDEMKSLMQEVILAVHSIVTKGKPLRVPETDNIIDMLFAYFLESSVNSIPESLRADYLKYRMMNLSRIIACGLEDISGFECEDCKNGTHGKTAHFDA